MRTIGAGRTTADAGPVRTNPEPPARLPCEPSEPPRGMNSVPGTRIVLLLSRTTRR